MTKELSFIRYKGHQQATAIANINAAYPWMNALEAKAALVKAVSGYKHEAVRARKNKNVVDEHDGVFLGANTSNHSLGKSSGVRRVRFGGVRTFGFGNYGDAVLFLLQPLFAWLDRSSIHPDCGVNGQGDLRSRSSCVDVW
jgi:hypothetical protein